MRLSSSVASDIFLRLFWHVVHNGSTPLWHTGPAHAWCVGRAGVTLPSSGKPTVGQRRLAAELRRLREESGRTAEAVAQVLGWSKAKVSRYELARSLLKPSEVERLLDVYEVRGEHREQLLDLAEEAAKRGWWEAYSDVLTPEHLAFIALEDEATSELQWQINVVPGLLQTEQYAREIFSGYQSVRANPPTVIERRVETRVKRQRVLGRHRPLELAAVIDESVLRRQRGDRSVMYEQLQHLADVSKLPNVTLQVLPLEGPKGLALDSFVILHFGRAHETQLHDVVSSESLTDYLSVEGETDTYEFRLAFEHLVLECLQPDESRELILLTAGQLWKLPNRTQRGIITPDYAASLALATLMRTRCASGQSAAQTSIRRRTEGTGRGRSGSGVDIKFSRLWIPGGTAGIRRLSRGGTLTAQPSGEPPCTSRGQQTETLRRNPATMAASASKPQARDTRSLL